MGLSDLQTIANNYEDSYFGHSDKALSKVVLDLLISVLEKLDTKMDELDTKIDALEARVEALE